MTLDQTVLIWCVALPGVIAAVGCALAMLAARCCGEAGTAKSVGAGLAVALGWWSAVATSLAGTQGWQWWPEDAWRQGLWPLLAWALFVALIAVSSDTLSWRWVVGGLLAIATAAIAMPSGAGWEDTLPSHRIWLSWIAASCLVNGFALERLSNSGAYRWSLLVALAGLAGPFALAASTYGSLAQWALAMVVATAVMSAFGVFAPCKSMLWVASIPATAAGATLVAAGRFHTYEDHPAWLYGVLLFLPSIITLVDLPIRHRSAWTRVALSGTASAALVAASIWQTLL